MLARIPGMFIAFEACRLLAWLLFFGGHAIAIDPATRVGVEAAIPSALASAAGRFAGGGAEATRSPIASACTTW